MALLEPTAAVATRAIHQLRQEQGSPQAERTLALLLAIPRDSILRSTAQADVAANGGAMLTRREVLLATFSTVSGALACARRLLEAGTDPTGAVAVAIHHATVKVDEAGIPISDALTELATVAASADAGMLVVSAALLPHLGHAQTARLTKGGAVEAHELAWREGQAIGLGLQLPAVAALLVAIVALGLLGARAFEDWQRGREEEARLLTETPFLPDGGLGPSSLAIGPPAHAPPVPPAPPTPAAAPAESPASEEEARPRAPRRRAGALTLVTTPASEVRLKGRLLGKTPLFKVPLRAGTHRLELRGEDGKRRILHVPIRAQETTALRLKLNEVPER